MIAAVMGRKFLRWLLILGCLVAAGAGWIVMARPLSMLLDRFHTVKVSSRAIAAIGVEESTLRIGEILLNIDEPQVPLRSRLDEIGRWNVSLGAKAVRLGEKGKSLGEVRPAAGETARSDVERSVLSWSTPFELNFMTGNSPSRKRHLYYRLSWQRPSGEKLELTWRYEQWFYSGNGWASGFMTHPGATGLVRAAISP